MDPHDATMKRFRRAEAMFRAEPSEWTRPDVVAAAVELLRAGVVAPSVAALAGDDEAEWREVQRDLDGAVQDLGLSPLSTRDAVRHAMAETVSDMTDRRIDAWGGLERIARIRRMAPPGAVGADQDMLGAMAVEYLSERGQPYGHSEADILASLDWYRDIASSRDIRGRWLNETP